MSDGLVTVVQCPSCVDGRGTVEFDVEAVRTVSGTTMGHTNLERVG